MIFCEPCRLKAGWPRPATWPFYKMNPGKCEVCRVEKDLLYDMLLSEITPEKDKSEIQKTIDKSIEYEYNRKAEDLTIQHVYGLRAGWEDRVRTDQLRQVFVKRGTEIDWRATYNLRLQIQQGHYKSEEQKRDRNR